MYHYPMVEQDGFCAFVSATRGPASRWKAQVIVERDSVYARLRKHTTEPVPVPNSYPSEERAIEAAYAHARRLISGMLATVT